MLILCYVIINILLIKNHFEWKENRAKQQKRKLKLKIMII